MDVYSLPFELVRAMAVERGIDPAKFTEFTLRRMVATRLKREGK